MKKIFKSFKKKGSSGFTLVEMVVSVALLAILMGGMMLFVSPIIQSFNDNTTNLTAENAATCVEEYITRSIRNSNQIAIFQNTNYTELISNTAYSAKIQSMNKYCTDVNGGSSDPTKINRLYSLKCISLKYDSTDQKYYLYEEIVKTDGTLDSAANGRKVFSNCLFDDLYLLYSFVKPKNADYPTKADAKQFREDAVQITVSAYTDVACNNLVFQGQGITELRQIKTMLSAGGSATDYNLTIEPSSPQSFADMAEGSRDIFIYYIVRQMV